MICLRRWSDNPHSNGLSMSSPRNHQLSPRQSNLLNLLPSNWNMMFRHIHVTDNFPRLRSHAPNLSIRPTPRILANHRATDQVSKRVPTTSRVLKSAWKIPLGKSSPQPLRNIASPTTLGKIMPCSYALVQLVNSVDLWSISSFTDTFSGNRVERCLSYDEKPLLLFQKLKDAQKNPVFMLKHIKDIRSPIAVAEQKHAARKATSAAPAPAVQTHHKQSSSSSRNALRPPKLEVQDLSAVTPLQSSLVSPHPGWPDGSLSPAIESNRNEDNSPHRNFTAQSHTYASGTTMMGSDSGPISALAPTTALDTAGSKLLEVPEQSQHQRIPNIPGSKVISYAVAIYPYLAELEDEFDVVV